MRVNPAYEPLRVIGDMLSDRAWQLLVAVGQAALIAACIERPSYRCRQIGQILAN